ncbi:MAG TPA: hypothetical protein VGP16_12455 [Asanoa sp.]|nr:hypothetical protein [Asanoa sp.]
MSEADLEKRYQRLLAWYPWSHRRVYEDEMLAVLVTGARPGQRWPSLGEAANLVASGLRARAGAAVPAVAGPAWRAAATVFGLLAAILLLSQRVVRLFDVIPNEPELYLRAIGWGGVVLAVLFGLRRFAAALAWVTVLGEMVLVAQRYDPNPVSAVALSRPLALGLLAAAALSVSGPPVTTVLRPVRALVLAGGIAVPQIIMLVSRNQAQNWQTWQDFPDGGTVYVFYGLSNSSALVMNVWIAAFAVSVLAATLAVLTLPAALRWRVATLAVPALAFAATVKLTLSGWAYSNNHMGHPIYLEPIQWALLIIVPLAALGLAAALVQWHEQASRLADLGRAADRQQATG